MQGLPQACSCGVCFACVMGGPYAVLARPGALRTFEFCRPLSSAQPFTLTETREQRWEWSSQQPALEQPALPMPPRGGPLRSLASKYMLSRERNAARNEPVWSSAGCAPSSSLLARWRRPAELGCWRTAQERCTIAEVKSHCRAAKAVYSVREHRFAVLQKS